MNTNRLPAARCLRATSSVAALRPGLLRAAGWLQVPVLCLLALLAILAAAPSRAQSALDGFDTDTNDRVRTLALQADGKLLVAGDFTQIGDQPRNRLARLNLDGSVDTAFNPDVDNGINSLGVQVDGKVLVGGDFTQIDGQPRNRLARLNPDGSLDADFNPDANEHVRSLAVQPDGKVLVGGDFSQIGGQARNRLARLNPDGSLDSDFDPGVNGSASILALQSDGKVLVGGNFTELGGQPRNHLARLNPDGSLDADFNPDANSQVFSLVVQSDGKVLVGGTFSQIGGHPRYRLARLNPDGSLDADFDPGGTGAVRSLAMQADGKLLVGGTFEHFGGQPRSYLARLNPDGSLDADFNPGANNRVFSLVVQADGKLLVGGDFSQIVGQPRSRLARLNLDGSLDTDLNPNANTVVHSVVLQADGKVLVGGQFTQLGGQPRSRLARLHADGSLDASFDPDSSSFVNTLAVQADDKVLVGGWFTQLGGQTRNRLARLHPDGSLDAGFDPDANDWVYNLAVQPDGKVLVGGKFVQVGGEARDRLARLNPDGSLDAGFNPGADDEVYSLTLQPDGKVLVGGNFTELGGQTRHRLARLHPDGELDADFDPGASGSVYTLTVQPDGKILVGGIFGQIGGQPSTHLARLNPDGSLDTAFNPAFSNWVYSLALQPDGKILVGGSSGRIARLNPDGSRDTGFSASANATVYSLAIQPDGKVLVGGEFTTLNGQTRNRIGRLSEPEAALQTLVVSPDRSRLTWQRSGTGPEPEWVQFEQSTDAVNYTPLGEASRIAEGWTLGGLALPHSQNLWLRARGASRGGNYSGSGSLIESVLWFHGRNTHEVTTSVPGGNGSVDPATQMVNDGEDASFTVIPDAGYHAALSGDTCTPIDNGDGTWTAAAITAGCAVTASFAINQHTVTAGVASGEGSITPPTQIVDHGDAASFTVTPGAGHHVVSVNGDTCTPIDDGDGTWTAAGITAGCAVTASFAINQHTVTAAVAGGNGSITPPTQVVDHGDAASFTVVPGAGHHVVSVNGDTCTPIDNGGGTWTAAGIAADCAVTASFAITQYTVTAAVASGDGSITPPTQVVDHGGAASFIVAPGAGHHVVSVNGDTCTPIDNGDGTWTAAGIAADCAVTASFAINQHTVTAGVASGEGSITPPTQVVNHGDAASFTVTPGAGHHVVSVNGDTCTPIDNGDGTWTAAAIAADCAVTASFAINQHTVTAGVASGDGSITPPTQMVNHGDAASFTVTADTGYHPALSGDTCTPIDNGDGTWTAADITAGCAVTASFAINQHTVTAGVANGNGSITPPTQMVDHGDAASFTVAADAGYHPALSGDTCMPIDNSDGTWTAADITADCAVTAHFAADVAAAIAVHGGDAQSAQVLAPFAEGLTVRVVDAAGAALQGITVNFAASSGGASAALSAASAVTDASGLASITATANAIGGSHAVTASVADVATVATFALTNTPFAAELVLAVSPLMPLPGEMATLSATVTGAGPLVPGGTVDFHVDGALACAAVALDAAGIATCPVGPLGTGRHQASASYSGDDAHASAASGAGIGFGMNTPVMVPVDSPWALALLIGLLGLVGLRSFDLHRSRQ